MIDGIIFKHKAHSFDFCLVTLIIQGCVLFVYLKIKKAGQKSEKIDFLSCSRFFLKFPKNLTFGRRLFESL
ncbi:hypothetical protein EGW35_06705 [Enterococcus durans]|nr:hypothetical protein [Enterococcus durans]ROX83177.1 hypothetical protein EGW35_06705 [Enterococcus durans]